MKGNDGDDGDGVCLWCYRDGEERRRDFLVVTAGHSPPAPEINGVFLVFRILSMPSCFLLFLTHTHTYTHVSSLSLHGNISLHDEGSVSLSLVARNLLPCSQNVKTFIFPCRRCGV